MVHKEVEDEESETIKELYVEVFGSRDEYIDLVMEAMDKTDEVELLMTDGVTVKLPSWTGRQ